MHRKVKGLLSVILTFAMVTATVAPVSADELSGGQQPAETQPVIEMTEEEPVDQDVEQEPAAEEEPVDQDAVQEAAAEEEPVDQDALQEPAAEGELTAADIVSAAEQLMTESNRTAAEREAAAIAFASASDDEMLDYLYGKLTEEQKKFRVFAGTDIRSESIFLDDGVVPGDTNLAAQSGTLRTALMNKREGDLKFYTLSKWKVWKVDGNGAPDSILTESSSFDLSNVATVDNFKKAANLINNGTGTDPEVSCHQPILEPVWEVYTFSIPVYDTDGNVAGAIDINAENYKTLSFPNMEGVCWKMIYNDKEYNLDTASEIWTNDTNGISKIGYNDFDALKAKLQAYIDDSVPEGPQYGTTGQEGKNGWYTSDVTITANEGCEVRLSETGEWASAVSVTESGTVTLYVKAANGVELPAETLTFFIDKTAPVITGVVNGETYYSNEVQVAVTDEHLQTVTKNGEGVDLNDPTTAYIVLNPSEESYTIFAEDAAGNQAICVVSVKQEESQPQDETAPVISGVENGKTYYGDQKVTITDENLGSITVNGIAVEVTGNSVDITLVPADGVYTIVAEDTAGNQTQYTVEVLETWVRDGITTNGKKNLKNARMYKLGSGKWTVAGDNTVYTGGGSFYVKSGGEYDFKKK